MIQTDGILFDMDGTIWDNTPLFAKSWTRAVQDHGYNISFTAEDLKKLFGRTMTEIADASIPDENKENRYATLKDCEIYEMEDLLHSGEITTYPGLEEVLSSLSKRVKLFIVSNCQQGYIESYLEITGHGPYFIDHLCYGDNGRNKAENIQEIIRRHSLKSPVYVGDIQKDKDAATLAGCGFIWASYGYGLEVDSCLAEIHSIQELDQLIE